MLEVPVVVLEGVREHRETFRQLGVARCLRSLLGDDRAEHDDARLLYGHQPGFRCSHDVLDIVEENALVSEVFGKRRRRPEYLRR